MLSSIYNYITGYVKVKCSNCNRELLMYHLVPNLRPLGVLSF